MSYDEPDTSILDELERRQRRSRLRERVTTSSHRTSPSDRVVRERIKAAREQGPVHGPPAPPGFASHEVQAKAAKSRKGLRNAARKEADKDAECEAILEILQRMAAGLTNNGGTKK